MKELLMARVVMVLVAMRDFARRRSVVSGMLIGFVVATIVAIAMPVVVVAMMVETQGETMSSVQMAELAFTVTGAKTAAKENGGTAEWKLVREEQDGSVSALIYLLNREGMEMTVRQNLTRPDGRLLEGGTAMVQVGDPPEWVAWYYKVEDEATLTPITPGGMRRFFELPTE